MSIAKILVPVTGAERDAAALAAAIAAAKPFNAHVVALIVHPDPRLSIPFMGAPLAPQVVQTLVDSAAEINVVATKAVRVTIAEAAKAAGIKVVNRPQKTDAVTCSLAEMEGFFATSIARVARLADLVVFGPIGPADGPDIGECFVEILTKTDRPVLLSSNASQKPTRSIAVAWDGRASACHAVTGAMPFLQRAETVTILHVGEPLQDREMQYSAHTSLGEVKEYLSLHGINSADVNFERGTKTTGQAILDAACSVGADLLVMGGYGHSHLRETIFGGVTAQVRSQTTLPVLMVH